MPSVPPPAPSLPGGCGSREHQVRTMLRRPRLAVIGLFFLTGLALATWVVNIPTVQQRLVVSHATLGALLLLLGLGSVVGMQGAGLLVDRVGSRRTAWLGALVLPVGVLLPAFATVPWHLGTALLVLGLGNGLVNVAMNEQAVMVERRWGKPIMSSFHAFFSVGGAVGAGAGALLQSANAGLGWSLLCGAAVVMVVAAVSLPALLPPVPAAPPLPVVARADRLRELPAGGDAAAPASSGVAGRIVALAVLAFLLMSAEGAASDWSALQAVERLDQPLSAASLAYAAFAIAMTAGRFAADSVAHRFGPVDVVRVGSAVATTGMLVVVLSAHYPLTLFGWVVFGLGLSGIVPQIFTAAGNLPTANQGVTIARVVSAGYVGLLAGPAVIGWLAGGLGLTHALVLPVVFCAIGILLARQVAPVRHTPVAAVVKQS